MPTAIEFITDRLPRVTVEDVRRFVDTVEILDAWAFAAMGPRGQKLPDWQLDPVKQQLTQTVAQEIEGIDRWTIYHALSEPLEGLRVVHRDSLLKRTLCWASQSAQVDRDVVYNEWSE